jgi:hypothetical protein
VSLILVNTYLREAVRLVVVDLFWLDVVPSYACYSCPQLRSALTRVNMIRQLASKLFEPFASPYSREEQGYPPATQPNNLPTEDEKPINVAPIDVRALVPREDKLLVFRALTGIDTAPALTRSGYSTRTAPNLGIYTRVVRAEQMVTKKYKTISLLINVCLGTQVIVAAILTSLGAANGPRSAVTVFGAINTIIAGILTYVKGSSLPDKLKYHKDEWKRVREYIEQREREFCVTDCQLDVYEEIYIVEEMYKRVKTSLETSKNGASGANAMTNAYPGSNAAPSAMMPGHREHAAHRRHESAFVNSPPPPMVKTSTRPESSATAVPEQAKMPHGE